MISRIGLFLLLFAAAASADKHVLIGRWIVTLERPGMQPRTSKGVLRLDRRGGAWSGTLRFDRILYARDQKLSDIKVNGKQLSFAIDHPKFVLNFEGEWGLESVRGKCDWKRLGVYEWTAERAKPGERPERFERGVRFNEGLGQGDAEKLGLDGPALDRLIAAAEKAQSDALIVLKDGKIVCERYFRGRRDRIHTMSVTKFVTAMAIALLIDEGKIASLDAPVSTWFPEWKQGRKAKVTLRHILSHTSGIRHAKRADALNKSKDKVKYVRGAPVVDEPGTKFSYNNDAIALLSGIIRQAAGQPADAYVEEKIFDPLGIDRWSWDRDGASHTITYANLALRARDLAKIGLLVAQNGQWEGEPVFPARWIGILGGEPGSAHNPRCGLGWWRLPNGGVYHDGYLGQALLVLPREGLVGVRLRAWDGTEAAEREFGGFYSLLAECVPK